MPVSMIAIRTGAPDGPPLGGGPTVTVVGAG
jgi:hypothetical protein